MNWQIIAAAFGVGASRAAIYEYRSWKARRIPSMDWDDASQAYVQDRKLRLIEKRATLAFIAVAAAHFIIGYNAVVNGWFN